ncbi:MAG: sulfotransferase domain-containing protein [Cyclobacteriaceae bacterium]
MSEEKSKIPNFYILGASKAGSTSLNYYLDQHPNIYMGSDKEPEFFQNDQDYSKGLDWYHNTYFRNADFNYPVGEASASYLYYSKVAERLSSLPVANQRFIVIMRNPIERAYSQYWHQVRRGETRSFQAAIDAELAEISLNKEVIFEFPPKSYYLGRSLYGAHIKNYLSYFKKEQFLFLFLEELKLNPESVFDKICSFLGVQEYHGFSTKKVYNSGATSPILVQMNRLKKSSIGRVIRRWDAGFTSSLKRTVLNNSALFSNREKYPEMNSDLKSKLEEFFSEDVQLLSTLLPDDGFSPNWLSQEK